jgi:hypothetical protein
MFCSGCGSENQAGLNYCNRCGKRLDNSDPTGKSLAANLTTALGYIGSAGFIGFIFLVVVLTKREVDLAKLVPIAFFYFAALFGICYLILHQGGGFSRSTRMETPASTDPGYLPPANTAQLPEARDMGVGSVTEHTTRTLEESPIKHR